jgi:hypothetical protein
MHAIQLETDELKLVIRALEQHAAANADELADCEYLIRTLKAELDLHTRLGRAIEALQELYDFGGMNNPGEDGDRSRAAYVQAGKLLRELRESSE